MQKVIGKILLGALVFSFCPIWRGAGLYTRHNGANLWQLLTAASRKEYEPFGCPHIPYSTAVKLAHEAWVEAGRPTE